MKLLVDIGNSRVKWACLKRGPLQTHAFARSKTGIKASLTRHWRDLADIDAVYVSNVAGPHIAHDFTQWCEQHWSVSPTFIQAEAKKFGVINGYDIPETLGVDRWLVMIAARQQCRQTVCVIDCGTALTIDVITQQGTHQGGLIIPGLTLMKQSLYQGTAQLSEVKPITQEGFKILATNTDNAIQTGTLYAVSATLEHIMADLNTQFADGIHFILTGGDAKQISQLLSSPVSCSPDLVMKGLALYARQHAKQNQSKRYPIKKQEKEKSGLPDTAN